MREILFRGKSKLNNKWHYGGILIDESDAYIESYIDTYENGSCPDSSDLVEIPIIYDTLGQYTGINDINGNKIFEGDIVHCVSRTDEANMVIIFESGAFHMIPCEKYQNYVNGCGYFEISWFDKEVIGNIYDNYNLIV